jgi:hypothetical protein
MVFVNKQKKKTPMFESLTCLDPIRSNNVIVWFKPLTTIADEL